MIDYIWHKYSIAQEYTMASTKRISDSYSIIGTAGNVAVSISNASFEVNGNTVVTSLGIPVLPTYTIMSLPTIIEGAIIYISDANSGNGAMAFGNATAWIDVGTGLPPI